MRIACPKCEYEPRAHDRWQCDCLTLWNTFDTQGRCPGCGKIWRHTACPHCHQWSPHHEWYRDLPPIDFEKVTSEDETPVENQSA